MTLRFNSNINKGVVIILLIANQFCFGFQTPKTKTDSVSYYIEKNNLIKALDYARKKADYYLKTKNYNAYCDIQIQKSEVYRGFNDTENTIKTLYEARNIAETYNLLEKQALVYRAIGNVNGLIFEYTKGKKYLHKALKIALQLKNNDLLIKINQGFLKICMETESDSALYYLNKVDFYTKRSKSLKDKGGNQNNFYGYYLAKNDNINAKKYLDSSYATALKTGDKNIIALVKNNIGVYYMTIEKN